MNVFFTTPYDILSSAKTYPPLHPTPPHYSPRLFFTSHHLTRDIYIASSNIMTRIICSWRDPIPTLIITPLYPILFRHSNRRVRSLLVYTPPFSVSHSFLLFLPLVLSLSLVHVNTSKHTDLRKIFFSFSLESGIQFCAIIGTPYWISPIKRHRGTIFFCNVEDDLWETKDTPSRFPALNSPNAICNSMKGRIQSVRRESRVFLSPRIRRTDSSAKDTGHARLRIEISPRIDVA